MSETKTTTEPTQANTGAGERPAAIPRRPPRPEPRPWLTPEDAAGWRPIGRVRTPDGRPPRMRVVVDLDDAQSAWVREEGKRAGLSPVEVLKRLVDAARSGGAGPGP
jgi:hypothetical protein